ncbi:MAG: four helix bundle protein [Candidatus Marinimicrobia bacterium]|nr:four helix bundle protein [Candidatus Neomarinimicrobiota bacterium]
MKNFRDLKVWGKAHKLALDTYAVTRNFPKDERYGLTSQLRRAAASIPTNIAEGCGRGSDRELAQFAQIAAGSTSEVDYLLQLSHDLGSMQQEGYQELQKRTVELRKMLASFIRTLRAPAS